jgi:hypothetical protein
MKLTDTLDLVRLDASNLAIMRNGKAIGYYGTAEGAFKAVLKHIVLGSTEAIEASKVIQAIDELNLTISTLCKEGKKL